MTIRERILLETRLWTAEKENLDKHYFRNLVRRVKPSMLWIEPLGNVVPVRELTNTDPGEMIVYQNMGGQCRTDDASFMAVLEDAVERGQVEYIVACGHSHCPAIHDIVAGVESRSNTARWMEDIRDLYEQHTSDLAPLSNRQKERKLSELNVHRQLLNLGNMDIVQRAWDNDRNLVLLGWYFDIYKGEVQEIFSMQSREILTQVAAKG